MGQNEDMEAPERQRAEDRLARLELLMRGHDRRHEVMDAVWDAHDEDEAISKVRGLLGATADPRVILDMRFGRLTADERKRLADEADELRRLLGKD